MGWNRLAFTSENEILSSLSDLGTVVGANHAGGRKILGTALPSGFI